jgi:hypothetical protein
MSVLAGAVATWIRVSGCSLLCIPTENFQNVYFRVALAIVPRKFVLVDRIGHAHPG